MRAAERDQAGRPLPDGRGSDSRAWIRRQLLRWYASHRRDLPWRRTLDPYRIWISEVMLQQTRAQTVIPYYENFLRQFPDVHALAAAPEDEVLACWSGLGYYSRARNLLKAAGAIVHEHGGQFPRDPQMAQSLPGVGRYTAGAVLSIAYGVPMPVLDGNVARVLARLCAMPLSIRNAPGKAEVWERSGALLSRRRPGEFNQALMELGATVCLPRQPLCSSCPIRRDCKAHASGQVEKFPVLARKASPVRHSLMTAIVRDRAGRLMLVQRPPTARWLRGFWELPLWKKDPLKPAPDGIFLREKLGDIHHTITTNHLEVEVFAATLRGRSTPPGARWIARADLHRQPVTALTRKALSIL